MRIKALEWITANAGEDDTMVVLPEGIMLNFLIRRRNPTPFLTYNPVLFRMLGDHFVTRAFDENRPDWVLRVHRDNSEHGARFFGVDYAQDLEATLDTDYRVIGLLGSPPFRGRKFGINVLRLRSAS